MTLLIDTHPTWLKPSKIPLTIVCGPPCGGKTTYVRNCKAANDFVIDLDDIRQQLDPTFRRWNGVEDNRLLNRAIRVRNLMLARLSASNAHAAWFIVSAPYKQERDWWQAKLGGLIVLLNPGMQECIRRAHKSGQPLAAEGVKLWEERSMRRWYPPVAHRPIAPDGTFLNENIDEADIEIAKGLRP